MRIPKFLCSNASLCGMRRMALVVVLCAIGCSEEGQDGTGGNGNGTPSGGTTWPAGGMTGAGTGGFVPASGSGAAGGAAAQTGGMGITAAGGGAAPGGGTGAAGGAGAAASGGTGDATGGGGAQTGGAGAGGAEVIDAGPILIADASIGDGGIGTGLVEAGGTEGPDGGTGLTDTGTASYSPCPTDGQPCKILPLGDSITYGVGFSGGYRVELFRKALAAGKNITFLGSQANGPGEVDGVAFPRNNEGHSGWTISQIAGIVPSPALDGQPDIILLMIGTNDISWGNPANAPDRLADLLDEIIAFDSDTLLVVAQITPLSFSNAGVEAYNAAFPAIVDGLAATGAHVMLVDMYTGFSTTMLGDGVHPNEQGYAFMADVWFRAIENVLH